jgi:hypothetical protein
MRSTETGLLYKLCKADCNGVDGGLEWAVKDTQLTFCAIDTWEY